MDYKKVEKLLIQLREEFHKYGEISDSNAKLEELLKILSLSFFLSKLKKINLTLEYVSNKTINKYGDTEKISLVLNEEFEKITKESIFFNNDGINIFGEKPELLLKNSNKNFIIKILKIIENINFNEITHNEMKFDLLNELFGHFVRDNFRDNKEDAQYMTPKEVIENIIEMIKEDVFEDLLIDKNEFLILDPTCGVGSFLTDCVQGLLNKLDNENVNKDSKHLKEVIRQSLRGQDKVGRMATIAKLNMLFLGLSQDNIYQGNSIIGGSYIDTLKGKISLILANPPYGAKYNLKDLKKEDYPLTYSSFTEKSNIDSEVLLLDKSINLLKKNGKLIIVIPDKIVSSKRYSKFRQNLMKLCNIKGIIELPAEAFAQAGTRTKTVILYLEKSEIQNNIFMATCDNLGFEVKERSGVAVKFEKGVNELEKIADEYKKLQLDFKKTLIINDAPSITFIPKESLIGDTLNPNFYKSKRLKTLTLMETYLEKGFEVKTLEEIVKFKSKERAALEVSQNIKHISLLHINDDNTINFQEVENFEPKGKGNKCLEDDLIFSRLNPRIKRIAVIPTYNKELVCSKEFSILKSDIMPSYELLALLNLKIVDNQILSLTSGTSSSHNRIKEDDLKNIYVPIPKTKELKETLKEIGADIENAVKKKYHYQFILENSITKIEKIIAGRG